MAKEQVKITVKRTWSKDGPTLLEKIIEYIKEQEVKEFDESRKSNQSIQKL